MSLINFMRVIECELIELLSNSLRHSSNLLNQYLQTINEYSDHDTIIITEIYQRINNSNA